MVSLVDPVDMQVPISARRTAWVAIDDVAAAATIAQALAGSGWHVPHVVHGCAGMRWLLSSTQGLPHVLVSGLHFRDGDGLQLIREIGRRAEPPAIFLASHQQRSVIKAAAALADACGLRFAGAAEQPADAAGIAKTLADFVVK